MRCQHTWLAAFIAASNKAGQVTRKEALVCSSCNFNSCTLYSGLQSVTVPCAVSVPCSATAYKGSFNEYIATISLCLSPLALRPAAVLNMRVLMSLKV